MTDDETLIAARNALSGIRLPDGSALLDSERVSGPVKAGDRLTVAISIEAAEVAAFSDVRSRAETALRAIPGGADAIVALTGEKPVSSKPAAPPQQRKRSALPEVRHVVAVASGKGGVGKSTTAVNLALGLRAMGLKVGILDADIHGPSLPTLLGLHGRPRAGADRRLLPMQAFGLSAMSMGLMVDAETAMVWRGPMVMSAITQMLADVDWGQLDVLIIDMPPGTGDAQLAIAQGTSLSGAVIVSTPQSLALIDARRGIAMFRKVDVPILGVIENMSYFVCPDCGSSHDLFGRGGAEAEAVRMQVPYLGAVPLVTELRAASDSGQPIVARAPDGPLGTIYRGIAQTLWTALEDAMPVTKERKLEGV